MELEKRQTNQIKRIDFIFLLDMAIMAKRITEEENNAKEMHSQENEEYCKKSANSKKNNLLSSKP